MGMLVVGDRREGRTSSVAAEAMVIRYWRKALCDRW
jgi:hypothetical protein